MSMALITGKRLEGMKGRSLILLAFLGPIPICDFTYSCETPIDITGEFIRVI